jgi:hypothetical protein
MSPRWKSISVATKITGMFVLGTPVTARGDLLCQRNDVFSSAALANRLRQTSSRAKLHTRISFKSFVPMYRARDTHAAPICSNCWRLSCHRYCEFPYVLLASKVVRGRMLAGCLSSCGEPTRPPNTATNPHIEGHYEPVNIKQFQARNMCQK